MVHTRLENRNPFITPAAITSPPPLQASTPPAQQQALSLPMAADWSWARRAWEKWVAKHVGLSGTPVRAALLLNYDPSAPSRLLPVIAEQEGSELKAVDMQPFLDFVKRGNLQMEFFPIGPNQYLVTSIHEHWFCARSVNSKKTDGEGVIAMHVGSYLLVLMYDGSVGSASQAMVAVDQFQWLFNRRNH